jgi:hypothetical protein
VKIVTSGTPYPAFGRPLPLGEGFLDPLHLQFLHTFYRPPPQPEQHPLNLRYQLPRLSNVFFRSSQVTHRKVNRQPVIQSRL